MEVPEYLINGFYSTAPSQFPTEMPESTEHFAIDDYLLDFSNEDPAMSSGFFDIGNSSDSSTITAIESCNSSVSGNIASRCFSSELCIPDDDLAELEWLSNFVGDSFEENDLHLHTLPFVSCNSATQTPKTPSFSTTAIVKNAPGKSRASPCDWSTRHLHLDAPPSGRKCLHCAAEKTPQWRAGPMGPKTLCNACGVRYKSGRLVPEYRPASSPSFVSAKHSNSHRKVLELRRQKEQLFVSQSSIFSASDGFDEFVIEHRNGCDLIRMI